MASPRQVPERTLAARPLPRAVGATRIADLAHRVAELAPVPNPALAARVAGQLRRLATAASAVPFRPTAGRKIGSDLFTSGLFGGPGTPLPAIESAVAAVLTLLRADGALALGLHGPDGELRLATLVDEMAAGLVRAAGERKRQEREFRGPASMIVSDSDHPFLENWTYRSAFDQASFALGIASLDGSTVVGNDAMRRLFAVGTATAQPISDLVHPDDLAELLRFHRQVVTGEAESVRVDLRLVRPDGSIVWVHLTGSPVLHQDGSPAYVFMLVEDITARQERAAQLRHASGHDRLTRLPGQAQADHWLHQAFHGGADEVAVCAIEIDGFAAVSENLGRAAADRLLLAVAGRLQIAAGPHLLTRTGAGTFLLLIADPIDAAGPAGIADRMVDAFGVPFVFDHGTVTVTVSIGVAQAPTSGTGAAELLRSADVACSWARSLGGGRKIVFDHQRDTGEAARFALLSGLQTAIGRDEFRVAYQPLVGLTDGALRGAEALVRWEHPDQGLIGPGRFIDLAEQSGAIVPLGRWVLQTACTQAASWWEQLGPDAPYVSVNVSPVQVAEPGWAAEVGAALEATGLPPEKLQLEITEQVVLGDEAATLASLSEIAASGVRLALDDFGTGYSSFAWLRRLPVHALKIDGSFVDGLRHADPDPVDLSIVRAVVDMAHALGLDVTAEWVETALQAEHLAALGCDAGQGRWFGDPGPGEWVPEAARRTMRN